MIVKPVVGAAGPLLFTQFLDDPGQFAEASYSVAPAIFQEYIPGTDHIRLNCFGDTCLAARIHSDALDWRPDLRVPIEAWPVPETLQVQVKAVLKKLGLLMGIIDLKVTPAGETVWLEVNPQGQFLFLEPLTGLRLAAAFSDFIVELLETV
jgi:glutathione synthase/RimK-type ligase-like ATP-grasp enzyme